MLRNLVGSKQWRRAGAVALVAGVLVAGCSGAADERSVGDEAGGGSQSSSADIVAAELAKGPAAGTQVDEDRQVVYTGSLTVRVDDAEAAADEAIGFLEQSGGYLGNQDSQLEGDREVTVTLRVPAEEFDEVMAKSADLGEVQARTVDSADVTKEVVDLKGRKANAEASAERLRELLADAQNVNELASIENTLTEREAEIEAITGELEVLGDKIEYATVTITFTEQEAPTVSDDLPGPLEALKAGAVTVVNVLLVALAAVAFALPFLPFILLGWWLVRVWRRRRPKKATPVAAGPWGTPLPPPPPPEAPWVPGAGIDTAESETAGGTDSDSSTGAGTDPDA